MLVSAAAKTIHIDKLVSCLSDTFVRAVKCRSNDKNVVYVVNTTKGRGKCQSHTLRLNLPPKKGHVWSYVMRADGKTYTELVSVSFSY